MNSPGIKPIVCVGAAIVDLNFRCIAEPILHTSNPATLERSPGGVVRNIAHHLALLGLPVELVTVLGKDVDGEWLSKQCIEANISLSHSLRTDMATGTFVAITTPLGELEIGAVATHTEQFLTIEFLNSKLQLLQNASIVIADCNLSTDTLLWLVHTCEQFNIPLIVETVSVSKALKLKKALPAKLLLVKPNLDEFSVICNNNDSTLEEKITQLHNQGIENIWLSKGAEGSVFSDGISLTKIAAPKVQILDVSGAGDAAVAGWVFAWLNGKDLLTCVKYGNAAAACLLEVNGAVRNDLTHDLLLKYL